MPGWLRRSPVVALVVLQLLVFILPNGLVQATTLRAPWLPLVLDQAVNAAIIIGLLFLFKTPAQARWVLVPLAALALFTTDFLHAFGGMPAVGTYLALGQTHARESLEYLKLKGVAWVLLAAGVWVYARAFGAIARQCPPGRFAKARKPMLCLCLAVLALYVNGDTWFIKYEPGRVENDARPRNNGFPLGFALSANRAYWYCRGRAQQQPKAPGQAFQAVRSKTVAAREVYVLVLGESASADFWSLGGYPYDTNARMRKYQDAGALVYFPYTVAQANMTAIAVPLLITGLPPSAFQRAGQARSLLAAFKEAGFTTFWISNQDEMPHMVEADFPILLHPRGGITYTNFDQDLLPYLDSVLASPKRKLFVVLHLMGSHVAYPDRVPPAFPTPGLPAQAPLASYLRTLCYTDHVLDEVIGRLSQVQGPSFLWYVSDHGQKVRPGEVGHGSIELAVSELHVPMLAWANGPYRAAFGAAFQRLGDHRMEVLTQGVTFPTVLGLAGVTYPQLDHSRDLSDGSFVSGRKPEVLSGRGEPRVIDDFQALLASAPR